MEVNESNLEMHRRVLEGALDRGLFRNEEQRQFWRKYKSEHEKVISGLNFYVQGLKVNCMVPLGTKALVKGSLIHTNEILTSIGDGYFVKYTAQGARELCERRIKHAEEMLQDLDKERDLLEMRKILPLEAEAFSNEETKEINEYWEQTQVDDWKTKHREREKEYRQKLIEVRKKEVKKIETEEDLFERLDQLELEEELADELNRQGIDDLTDAESSSEASDSELEEEIHRELEKLRQLRLNKSEKSPEVPRITEESTEEAGASKSVEAPEGKSEVPSAVPRVKRVSFVDVNEEHADEEVEESGDEPIRIRFSHSDVDTNLSGTNSEGHKDPDSSKTVKPNLCARKHGSDSASPSDVKQMKMSDSSSPADIYRIFNSPKSILKRREGDALNREIKGILEEDEDEEEEEEGEERIVESVYESVVKDIKERPSEVPDPSPIMTAATTITTRGTNKIEDILSLPGTSTSLANATLETPIERKSEVSARPVSKFRRERNLKQH